jgi:hypothetical protein
MTCAALCGAATSAIAGGSPIEIEDGDDLREPGETVTLSGSFWKGTQAPVSTGPMGGALRIAPSAAAWRVHVLQIRRKHLLARMRDQRAEAREVFGQAT